MSLFAKIFGPFFFLYWLIIILPITFSCAILVILLTLFLPQKWASKLRVIARFWGWIGVRLTFSGVTVLDAEKAIHEPAVVISNHQSPFDIFAALGFYPVDFVFLSKKEVFKVPLVGMAMHKIGYLEVDRANPRAAANSMKNVIRKLKENERVLIYPEGTRSKNAAQILPFKPGALVAAKQGELPILPIVVYGTQQIRSMTNPTILWPSRIVIQILDPVRSNNPVHPAHDTPNMSDQAKAEALREMVQNAYNELAKTYGKV
ncbi:MAG: 1-acyl-sn-glycerol-3-phosphate acyltransferase [Leptospiraceae bacterium]|nr:1-acyl-sn-glycerol-3-phosphate acyltransferase [Leptospiraceae bacterium]